MERSILHCDMNNFYASVEILYDASLAGKPVAVCGDPKERCGIVLAKSEEAKRFGVKTGEAIWQAQSKCPQLIVVPPHFERYEKFSRLAKKIYCEYTDLVEPFGMDECWLDVTASRLAFGDGVKIGQEIRRRIKKELELTISVGVSYNKPFAKLGSDMKKPDALTHLPTERIEELVWPLPVGELIWVGPKSAATLSLFGIRTIGALAHANDLFLKLKFGKLGEQMKRTAKGEDTSPVTPIDSPPPIKSIGHGATVPRDLETEEEVWLLIFALCQDVGKKLRFHKMRARGVAIECKDRNFFTKTFQTRLPEPSDCTMTLARAAFDLFKARYLFREPIRAISLRAIDLETAEAGQQLSLFLDARDFRNERLDSACDELTKRFGEGTIGAASLMHYHLPHENSRPPAFQRR